MIFFAHYRLCIHFWALPFFSVFRTSGKIKPYHHRLDFPDTDNTNWEAWWLFEKRGWDRLLFWAHSFELMHRGSWIRFCLEGRRCHPLLIWENVLVAVCAMLFVQLMPFIWKYLRKRSSRTWSTRTNAGTVDLVVRTAPKKRLKSNFHRTCYIYELAVTTRGGKGNSFWSTTV